MSGLSEGESAPTGSRGAEIWVSPRRKGGAPCVMGTRIPTATVARYVADAGVDEALMAYPALTPELIEAALWFEREQDAREAAWRGEVDGLLDRLGAVREYVDEPGNWSALDGRRQHLLHLIAGGSTVPLSASQGAAGVTTPGSANEGRRTAHSDSESYAWPTNGSGK